MSLHLTIDPEFEGKIPPLREEELKQLEENILADGVVINPLIVWDGVIVDGHNRYRILQKHPKFSSLPTRSSSLTGMRRLHGSARTSWAGVI